MISEYLKKRANKKIQDGYYVNACSIAAAMTNYETFSKYKNCFEGREVALCGAGPSLQRYNPIEGAVHIALNRALLNKNVKYDWFIGEDWDGIDFFSDDLLKYDCVKFLGCHGLNCSIEVPESYRIKCHAYKYYADSYMVESGFQSRFICDIDRMAIGNMPNIALQAMQIVLFTNPKKIYLVGCDASSGHFVQPLNLSADRIEKHEKDLKASVASDNVIDKWRELREFISVYYPDVEIVSINPVGLKGMFKDEYQEEKG